MELHQKSYNVMIHLTNITFVNLNNYKVLSIDIASCSNAVDNIISINGCNFENNTSAYLVNTLIDLQVSICDYTYSILSESGRNRIVLQNCRFVNNTYTGSVIKVNCTGPFFLFKQKPKTYISIIGCLFQLNTTQFINFASVLNHESLLIENTKFISCYHIEDWAIILFNVNLILKGPVIFHKIRVQQSLINAINDITVYDYIEISSIVATSWISGRAYVNLKIMEYAHINITNNILERYIMFLEQNDHNFQLYPFCFFQFYKNHKRGKGNRNPIVTIMSTNIFSGSDIVTNINCRWYPNSLYYGQNPLTV